MARWTRRELTNGAALCLELGSGLLENGAETSRVEESILYVGAAMGMEVEAMVHPTAVTVGFGHVETITRVARIKTRVIDLNKVALLNEISREIGQGSPDVPRMRERIREVREAACLYSTAERRVATAAACAFLTLVVGGGPADVMVSLIAGSTSAYILERYGSSFPSFLSLFGVGTISTVFGVAAYSLWGLSTESIIVGSLLYQMPGLAIVSAMRDLMAGELVSGNARLAEAVLVTLGMASGVITCLSLAVRMGLDTSL